MYYYASSAFFAMHIYYYLSSRTFKLLVTLLSYFPRVKNEHINSRKKNTLVRHCLYDTVVTNVTLIGSFLFFFYLLRTGYVAAVSDFLTFPALVWVAHLVKLAFHLFLRISFLLVELCCSCDPFLCRFLPPMHWSSVWHNSNLLSLIMLWLPNVLL